MEVSFINLFITLVLGSVLSFITNLFKRYFPNASPQILVIILSVLLGIMYQLFLYFIPEEVRQNVINFMYGVLTSAVFVYEFIWKNLHKPKPQT